jgi:colicin import membrane protein
VSRREDEKKRSLSALGRIADRAKETPWARPEPKRVPPPPPKPKPAPPPPPPAPSDPARLKRLQERREKLEEEQRLRERRERELRGGASLEWRGMSHMGVPSGIRRTAFDRVEPSVSQKISDVLGDAKEKEGRAKARAKGRRQR